MTSKGCPVDHSKMMKEAHPSGGCPVDHSKMSSAPLKMFTPPERTACDSSSMDVKSDGLPSVGDVFPDDASPHPTQRAPLSSAPVSSNIPKGGTGKEETWTFPSPQRFYNAMKKKGWDPQEREMPWVVSIHNTVNERCWKKVMAYENFHGCEHPKLVKFRGKPDQLSLKAKLRGYLGYIHPFDRHDWTVDRCGEEVTYIIDFYEGKPPPGLGGEDAPPRIFLDVRPAPSVGGLFDRARMQFQNFFSINHSDE